MDDISMVEIFDRAAGLDEKPSYFRHGEEFALLEGVGQRAVGAYFQDDVG